MHPELAKLKFQKTWRPYQQRVLDACFLHLADRKLHIVAAPGAGKTTLGLEMFRRLGVPALVLSPTRTIRDQWVERLRDFIEPGAPWPPAWISRSLDAPGLLSSLTYQALHSKSRVDEKNAAEQEAVDEADGAGDLAPIDTSEIELVVSAIKTAGVGTIILDEAHHLRAEWWKALTNLIQRLDDVNVIALTATPPYDSAGNEWARYEELCGVIDEEISVPELVKAGTLSAHQDFVWTVVAAEREAEFATRHAQDVTQLVNDLLMDERFSAFVSGHPWVVNATADVDGVFGDPESAVVLLAYLKARSLALPEALLSLLDMGSDDVPELTLPRWEKLLTHYLFTYEPTSESAELKAQRQKLARRLRECHLLSHRQINLTESKLVKRHLTQSTAKIDACIDIHRHERRLRGDALRQVILTDYIRDDDIDHPSEGAPRSLGAWPIFRHLVAALDDSEQSMCALLTGRLVIVHEQLVRHLEDTFSSTNEVAQLPGFRRLISTTGEIVGAITRCLDAGRIRCLIGTRSLLGEGWDAPCINSLVIASNVGAYMLTNQMRGRALRVHKGEPLKAASVWHIIAIALDRRAIDVLIPPGLYWPGLMDLRELDLRFKTFVGLDEQRAVIENSLVRLHLPCLKRERDRTTGAERLRIDEQAFRSSAAIEVMNKLMIQRLSDLASVREQWQAAIDKGSSSRIVPSIKTNTPPQLAGYHVRLTLQYFLMLAVAAFGMIASFASLLPDVALVIFGIAALYALPKLLRAAYLAFRHLPVDGSIHQIGLALRDTLCALRMIDTPASRVPVQSHSDGGSAYIRILGGSFRDQALFSDCMREILSPIENPRYLIVREGSSFGMKRKDYHSVPTALGVKKEFAEVFLQAWQRRVGPAELVYTRSAEKREVLLRARARAFSNSAAEMAQRIERWL